MPASDPYPTSAKIVGGVLAALVLVSAVTVVLILCDPARAELKIQSIDGISPERAGRMLSIEDEIQRVLGLPRGETGDLALPTVVPAKAGTQNQSLDSRLHGNDGPGSRNGVRDDDAGMTLTQDEYDGLKQMLRISGATPLQVGLVKGSMNGTALLLNFLFWLVGLIILRYAFNRWFDANVYDDTWASTCVICMMLWCTKEILVAAVQ